MRMCQLMPPVSCTKKPFHVSTMILCYHGAATLFNSQQLGSFFSSSCMSSRAQDPGAVDNPLFSNILNC